MGNEGAWAALALGCLCRPSLTHSLTHSFVHPFTMFTGPGTVPAEGLLVPQNLPQRRRGDCQVALLTTLSCLPE